jgi:hypothetical protein
MPNPTAVERVQISNTFLVEARRLGEQLFELRTGTRIKKIFHPRGGTLNAEKSVVLSLLAYSALIIEARANHLVDALVDANRVSNGTAHAARWLNPLQKWLLLPTLYGSRRQIDTTKYPHKAVAEICGYRNDIMHVKFKGLATKLPSGAHMLTLFEQLTIAVADLNLILRRDRRPQKRLIAIGRFS